MSQETDRQLDDLYENFIDTISAHRLTFTYPENDIGECEHCQLGSTGIAEHLAEELFKDVEETIRKAKEQAWDEGVTESGLDLDYTMQILDNNPYRSQS